MANIKVNGRWLADRAAFGELQWSSRYRGGSEVASWRVDSTKRLSYRPGQLVELVEMGAPLWTGTLLEPDGDTFHARGLYYQAARAKALDSTGAVTAVPLTAIAEAKARGLLTWRNQKDFGSAPIGDVSEPIAVSEILDRACDIAGKVWQVDARGDVAALSAPTIPKWHVVPGAADLTVAEDSYASSLYGRYLSSDTGLYATVIATDAAAAARFGPREETVDLSRGGTVSMSATDAQSAVNNILAAGAARPGWANGLRLAAWEITTPGEAPANLRQIRGGDMIRILGQMDMTIASGPKPYIDVIADEVSYEDGSQFIDIKPVGLEVRGLEDALSAALG